MKSVRTYSDDWCLFTGPVCYDYALRHLRAYALGHMAKTVSSIVGVTSMSLCAWTVKAL